MGLLDGLMGNASEIEDDFGPVLSAGEIEKAYHLFWGSVCLSLDLKSTRLLRNVAVIFAPVE